MNDLLIILREVKNEIIERSPWPPLTIVAAGTFFGRCVCKLAFKECFGWSAIAVAIGELVFPVNGRGNKITFKSITADITLTAVVSYLCAYLFRAPIKFQTLIALTLAGKLAAYCIRLAQLSIQYHRSIKLAKRGSFDLAFEAADNILDKGFKEKTELMIKEQLCKVNDVDRWMEIIDKSSYRLFTTWNLKLSCYSNIFDALIKTGKIEEAVNKAESIPEELSEFALYDLCYKLAESGNFDSMEKVAGELEDEEFVLSRITSSLMSIHNTETIQKAIEVASRITDPEIQKESLECCCYILLLIKEYNLAIQVARRFSSRNLIPNVYHSILKTLIQINRFEQVLDFLSAISDKRFQEELIRSVSYKFGDPSFIQWIEEIVNAHPADDSFKETVLLLFAEERQRISAL